MSYSPKRKNKFDKASNYNTHRPGIIIKGIFQFLTVDDRITDEAAQYNVMPQTPMTRLNQMKSFLASSTLVARAQRLKVMGKSLLSATALLVTF